MCPWPAGAGLAEDARGCSRRGPGTNTTTVQYSTVQYSAVQYSTVQYSTVQYSTVQYSQAHRGPLARGPGVLGQPVCGQGVAGEGPKADPHPHGRPLLQLGPAPAPIRAEYWGHVTISPCCDWLLTCTSPRTVTWPTPSGRWSRYLSPANFTPFTKISYLLASA